MFATTKTR